MDIQPLSTAGNLTGKTGSVGSILDKDAFMKLILAQLSNPNPFKPQDIEQMMNQFIQLGLLERMLSIEDQIKNLNRTQALAQASALIGHEVTVADGEATVTGIVDRATISGDRASIIIDGKAYALSNVIQVGKEKVDQTEQLDQVIALLQQIKEQGENSG
ncbi:MAG: hypothetical protein H0Z39_08205 [Peptococcaceae bacterium]|nr:hypothetical protein [Peptococcaceae bacterium]